MDDDDFVRLMRIHAGRETEAFAASPAAPDQGQGGGGDHANCGQTIGDDGDIYRELIRAGEEIASLETTGMSGRSDGRRLRLPRAPPHPQR